MRYHYSESWLFYSSWKLCQMQYRASWPHWLPVNSWSLLVIVTL